MSKFRLIKKSADQQLTRFQVLDSAGSICGSINVENREVPDLLRCWSGSTAESAPPKGSAKATMVAAFLQAKRTTPFSRATILRGC